MKRCILCHVLSFEVTVTFCFPFVLLQMGMMDGPMGQKRPYPGGSPYPQSNQYGGRQYGNMPGYPMGGRGQNMPPSSMGGGGGGNQYGHQVRTGQRSHAI